MEDDGHQGIPEHHGEEAECEYAENGEKYKPCNFSFKTSSHTICFLVFDDLLMFDDLPVR